MKKKKHKGNPYRDPKTGKFASSRPSLQDQVDWEKAKLMAKHPRQRPLLNWGLVGLLALTLLFWAAIGITLKGWLQ